MVKNFGDPEIFEFMKKILLLMAIVQAGWGSSAWAEEAFPFTAVCASSQVNVRAGQNRNYEELTELQEGEEVVVVEKSFSWYKIKLPLHARSYVSGQFVEKLADGIGMVTGNHLNIRARESSQASVIGRLSKGDLVKIVGESGEWLQIEPVEQSFGWVADDYIVFQSASVPPPRVVEPPVRNIYKRKHLADRPPSPPASPFPMFDEQPRSQTVQPAMRVVAAGVIQGLGTRSLTENIRHQLVIEGKTAYYLKGYRSVMDGFQDYQVKIEGEVLPDIKAPHPVVLVTKIHLIL